MKTIIIVSPKNRTVYNFRGDLIKELQKENYHVVVTGPNQDDMEAIQNLNVEFVDIPMNKDGVNPLKDLKYMNRLRKLFKKYNPDACLCYTIKPVVYGGIAARLSGIKNINLLITGTGFLFSSKSLKARILKSISLILYKVSLAGAKIVIFQNPDDRKEFIENKLVTKMKSAVVNGSGVNMKHFIPVELPNDLTFFMLGRLLNSKGVKEYIDACRILKASYPDVRFRLLGNIARNMKDGVAEDVIKSAVNDGIIELIGETNDVRKYYSECSVFVLPSYREGTPRSVLEAMASGRPIVTCDVPGCRETVIEGENGFLVPPRDAHALAETMRKFILDRSLIPKMGRNSLELCRRKFDVDIINKDMLTFIE